MGLVWVLGFSSIIADGVSLVKHLNLNPNTNNRQWWPTWFALLNKTV